MKKCSRCHKAHDEETKCCARCKEKASIYNRKWRTANPEKVRASKRKDYETHKGRCAAASRKWAVEHPDKVKAIRETWQATNPERARESRRKWATTHPDYWRQYKLKNVRFNIYWHNWRARDAGADGTLTQEEVRTVFDEQEGCCAYCGELLYSRFDIEINIDHKTPLSRGGSGDIENIALACRRCNYRKGTKTAEEFKEDVGKAS